MTRRLTAALVVALFAALLTAVGADAAPTQGDPGVRCVDHPPRQTFDPLSPPCVPTYDGDNGGATAPGVTGSEIRLLVALEGGVDHVAASDQTNRVSPTGAVYDLAQDEATCERQSPAPGGCSHVTVRGLRVWQSYFNQRFQTYDRTVRFFVGFTTDRNPNNVRVDASRHLAAANPFAVVPLLDDGFDPYVGVVRGWGRMVFADHGLLAERDLSDDLVWDFQSTIDHQAANFASVLCRQVVARPTARNAGSTGTSVDGPLHPTQPRRIGLITTDAAAAPHLAVAGAIVRAGLESCGGVIVDESRNTACCAARDLRTTPVSVMADLTRFRGSGVTTIVWAGGFNSAYTDAATAIGYRPEWVLLGDGLLGNSSADVYGATGTQFHRRAVVLESRLPEPDDGRRETCELAFREVDSTTSDADMDYVCDHYRALFLTFLGFQTTGPHLTDRSVAEAFRALPVRASSGFGGTHGFVRGGHLSRYDATTRAPSNGAPGCWRIASPRHTPGAWFVKEIFDWPPGLCDRRASSVRIDGA